MLLGLMIPEICLTSTSFDWWYLWTIFSLRFKCLMPFEVTEAAHWTAALLLLYILVLEYASGIPMLLEQLFRDWSLEVHSLVDVISDPQELRVLWFWRIDFNAIVSPERHIRELEREQNLNSPRGVPSSTALPNWPPSWCLRRLWVGGILMGKALSLMYMPLYSDDMGNDWIIVLLKSNVSGRICRIDLCLWDIWEHEMRTCNVKDVKHCCMRQEMLVQVQCQW